MVADGSVSLPPTTYQIFLVLNVTAESLESHQLTAASAEGKIYFLSSYLLLFRLLTSCRETFRKELPCMRTLLTCSHLFMDHHIFVFSSLFPDVVNCMQTDNLELKKLVYLYLMNYAKSQPDMAIMAVNTFVKVG